MVKWSDLSEKLIYRTYPEIHTFHVSSSKIPNQSRTPTHVFLPFSSFWFCRSATEIVEGDVSHRGGSDREEGQDHPFARRYTSGASHVWNCLRLSVKLKRVWPLWGSGRKHLFIQHFFFWLFLSFKSSRLQVATTSQSSHFMHNKRTREPLRTLSGEWRESAQ